VYKKPNITKNKMGGTKILMYLTIGYKLNARGEPLGFVHWLCVPPQRGHKPLTERFETWETEEKLEKTQLKERYTEAFVNSLTNEGVKNELRTLGVRSVAAASAKDTLIRVGRTGSRVGELRIRDKGRPSLGGELRPHTPTAYYFSEYLSQCL
jgi:hypothetical protein